MSDTERSRFEVDSGRSAVLLEARSTVGPIAFGTTNMEGYVELRVRDGAIDLEDAAPSAELQMELSSFSSGNPLYDAELLQRIGARQHPITRVELRIAERISRSERYRVEGDLTFHGITRRISGTVGVQIDESGILRVAGEHVFDIRDFAVATPSVLMLRIYPDVRVELQLEATRAM